MGSQARSDSPPGAFATHLLAPLLSLAIRLRGGTVVMLVGVIFGAELFIFTSSVSSTSTLPNASLVGQVSRRLDVDDASAFTRRRSAICTSPSVGLSGAVCVPRANQLRGISHSLPDHGSRGSLTIRHRHVGNATKRLQVQAVDGGFRYYSWLSGHWPRSARLTLLAQEPPSSRPRIWEERVARRAMFSNRHGAGSPHPR